MKKILIKIAFAAAVLFSALSCASKIDYSDVVGEWHYSEESVDVYLALYDNHTFELFQKVGSGRYRLYTGEYGYDGVAIYGKYDDGVHWKYSYAVGRDGDNLVLSAGNEFPPRVYEKVRIPFEVRNSSTLKTKSESEDILRFL